MSGLMELCLAAYYDKTKWNEKRQYSNLLCRQRAILDFAIPYGLSFIVGKNVSPFLKSSYSLGLPVNSSIAGSAGSIAFLFSSTPLDLELPSIEDSRSLKIVDAGNLKQRHAKEHPSKSNPSSTSKTQSSADFISSCLLYGRVFRDARLEYLYTHRLSPKTSLLVTGISSLIPSQAYVNYTLQRVNRHWSTEASFHSEGALFGVRWLYTFGKGAEFGEYNMTGRKLKTIEAENQSHWAVGGELYYTAQEKSGGLSLGLLYHSDKSSQYDPSTITFTFNPLLGHLSTSYTTTLSSLSAGQSDSQLAECISVATAPALLNPLKPPEFQISTRYNFNVYSFDSSLAIGIEYSNPMKSQLLKLRVGVGESGLGNSLSTDATGGGGIKLVYEEQFGKVKVGLGVGTELRTADGCGIVDKPLRKSLGLELRYDW